MIAPRGAVATERSRPDKGVRCELGALRRGATFDGNTHWPIEREVLVSTRRPRDESMFLTCTLGSPNSFKVRPAGVGVSGFDDFGRPAGLKPCKSLTMKPSVVLSKPFPTGNRDREHDRSQSHPHGDRSYDRFPSRNPVRTACVLVLAVTLRWFASPSTVAQLPDGVATGSFVDVAPWGEMITSNSGQELVLWWEDPRDIHRVSVTFAEQPKSPSPIKLQWWQSQWPHHRIPRDRPSGAGESGWAHIGDLYQGRWIDADGEWKTDGATWTFTFNPVNSKEFPNLGDFDATYRTTMKLRITLSTPDCKVSQLRAFTDSTWQNAAFEVCWDTTRFNGAPCDAKVEVFNGYAHHLVVLAKDKPMSPGPDGRYEAAARSTADRFRAEVWFTRSPNQNTFDDTVVTVRTPERSFSFNPATLVDGKTVFSPYIGVLVKAGTRSEPASYADAEALWKTAPEKPLYTRVFDQPEQSLARAFPEQPPRPGRIYLPVGTAGGRQRFGVNADGSVFCVNDRIDQPRGKDTDRRKWGGHRLTYKFNFPSNPDSRRIEDECLPIIHTQWERNGIKYTQTAFATRLAPGSLGFPDMQADDTTVLMMRISVENVTSDEQPAAVVLGLSADGKTLPLVEREGLIYAKTGQENLLRAAYHVRTEANVTTEKGQIVWSGDLPAGESAHLVLKIPFITLDRPEEIDRLRDLSFEGEFQRVKSFWANLADASAQIRTPVPEINRFYRAHVSHLFINCGREVGADRLAARVGSFSYGVFGNESCMMITDLDRRGFHADAERCLETFLHYQGTVALPGDYSTKDGVFNGANGWESGGYNQHHGWILWAMGEHYWYSGDKAWLQRNAPKLLKACNWISRERSRTKNFDGARSIERGLLPPGSLEDIGDWRVWMSNNVFSWWGMDSIARALADINHPEAAALQAEADAYRRDILSAFREASVRAPLVPLRDGSWIPQIPSEVHRRGRTFGWITVTLEGSIYLLRTGLIAPDDPMAVNIMQDFEDNLYLSDRYGYSWTKHGAQWFSRGGISMQPNLLCSPHPYLMRDEIKHYLRAYFNAFASCYYPDTQMMCEHPLPDLGDFRGDHYKSSDESNSTYWLRMMFIDDERGDDLRLGMAIPRAWLADGCQPQIERSATHFGPMSLRFISQAADGKITAQIDPPKRRAPNRILLRFRHPEAKPIRRVQVNGQPWDKVNVEKEWVELPQLDGPATVVAFY